MSRKNQSYEEGSLADFAHQGLKRITHLAKSQKITDKLIALNMLLFVLILTFNIGYWLNPSITEPLSIGILLGLGFVFSLIASLVYGPIVEIISDLTINKINSLRIGSSILFTDLSIAIIGYLFKIELLLTASMIIIGVQLIIILFGSVIDFSKEKITDKTISLGQLRDALGTTASIITIINFLVWLITVIVSSLL